MEEGNTRANFPETCWTLVQQAGDGEANSRDRALEQLCAIYWPPVYAFIRSQGKAPHIAEDLTQGFFQQLLKREDFGATSQDQGKLRTYLLACAKNFLRNDYRDRNRQKRGGGQEILPLLDEAEDHYSEQLADSMSPERLFDRNWVLSLLGLVQKQLGKRYELEGRGELYAELSPFLSPTASPPQQKEIAERLGMKEGTINVAVHRLRKQYRESLKDEIARTLHGDLDVEEELQHLFAALS